MSKLILSSFFSLLFITLNAGKSPDFAKENFILKDIEGKSYDLDQLLSTGHYVILNFGATWSPSSWNYEHTNTLNYIDELYQRANQQKVVVLFVESDVNTNLACLQGSSDCTSSSMGDWTSLVKYPIIDLTTEDLTLLHEYGVDEYPSVLGIAPNRSVTTLGQSSMREISNWISGNNDMLALSIAEYESNALATIISQNQKDGSSTNSLTTLEFITIDQPKYFVGDTKLSATFNMLIDALNESMEEEITVLALR